ncbi:O-succinylhomoserine sulfhydrylase [Dongia soli]|uniref:O-succinylhomoserine sulfhydrylase n=1 Tax=Dongia soli TaxID=600628 RepID=A0ABU5E4U8_9PROT|nr:O-succinylhomoserine sulfhydrylase [Dongia soli]MDY0881228.1 O-succinylhomoserine sulfhydrylase [Dongia soli]
MTVKRDIQPNWRPATRLVHGGQLRSQYKETSEAIFMTSGYVYETAEEAEAAFDNSQPRFVYSRFGNPTVSMFEERMALLEGAEMARATASGMAAVFAALACQVKAGDRVVASDALFGSCQYIVGEILPKWGVETAFVDGRDLNQWRDALSKPTKAVFLETPSNPGLRLVDVPAVAELAHKAGACVVVDNVFATPLLQQPLKQGADVVVYSATKHIDGQGRSLGGVILGSRKFIEETLQPFLRHTGPSLSPMNAWILLKGLETLELRVQKQSANALKIAQKLQGHSKLKQVHYPTLDSHPQAELARRQMAAGGTMVGFDLAGGKASAFRFLNALKLVLISNNLGDSKSLATHPATTTHQRLTVEQRAKQGIDEGMIRLSIGLEDVDDLLDDLLEALKAA